MLQMYIKIFKVVEDIKLFRDFKWNVIQKELSGSYKTVRYIILLYILLIIISMFL